jgi:hypothetical protein
MKGLKWWLWIVGILYVLEGGALTLRWFADPEGMAAMWTATQETGVLDSIAVQAVLIPTLFVTLSWVLLGVLMLYFTRAPARSGVLVVVVVALELFAWMPLDTITLTYGWSPARSFSLLAIHLVIATTGILALRTSRAARSREYPILSA